jgi:hypothetical protein
MKFVKNRALLYQRANGYSYDAVKILMPAGVKKSIYAPCVEHVPPTRPRASSGSKTATPRREGHWPHHAENNDVHNFSSCSLLL